MYDPVGAKRSPNRLPQKSGRQTPAVAERTDGIQQQYVQVAVQAEGLKSVIQQEDIRVTLLQAQLTRRKAIAPDYYRQAGHASGQQKGFITTLVCGELYLQTVRYDSGLPLKGTSVATG